MADLSRGAPSKGVRGVSPCWRHPGCARVPRAENEPPRSVSARVQARDTLRSRGLDLDRPDVDTTCDPLGYGRPASEPITPRPHAQATEQGQSTQYARRGQTVIRAMPPVDRCLVPPRATVGGSGGDRGLVFKRVEVLGGGVEASSLVPGKMAKSPTQTPRKSHKHGYRRVRSQRRNGACPRFRRRSRGCPPASRSSAPGQPAAPRVRRLGRRDSCPASGSRPRHLPIT